MCHDTPVNQKAIKKKKKVVRKDQKVPEGGLLSHPLRTGHPRPGQSVFTAQGLYVGMRRRGQRKGWRMRDFHTLDAVKKQTPPVLCLFESTLPAYSLNNLGHLILIWIKFKSRAQSTQSTCQKKPPLCISTHTCGRTGWARIAERRAPSWANSSISVPLRLLPNPAPYLCIHTTPKDTWQLKHESHCWEHAVKNESYLVWNSWSHL